MSRFARSRGKIQLHLDSTEFEVFSHSVNELLDLLDDGSEAEPLDEDDPFAAWEASFGAEPGIEDDFDEDERDPVMQRLFPRAYPDDPEAASDFARFTDASQRQDKVTAACMVLDDLDELRGGTVRIRDDHVDAWLKTLNNLRLVLSVMLGISDEISASEAAERPEEDPRSWLFTYYGWLGWMLESLLEAVMAPE
ncbi:DUF2017 domain-containing protein [Propionibacteriaceae bacterium Y1923]|uniref:DUF2017 domain-containing protein n=1 Tax=Aestuariimicrobium sp. Y1814 TaxID=3418742 RepID=UPI003C26AC6B